MSKTKLLIILLVIIVFILPTTILAAGQYYQTRKTDKTCAGNDCPGFSRNIKDEAYCVNKNDCVYNGRCYDYINFLSINGSREFCATNSLSGTVASVWYDPDAMKLGGGEDVFMCEYMGFKPTKAGEANVGEYTNTTTIECCGDDANEYFKTGTDNTKACCNSNSDYVFGGKCHSQNKARNAR